MNSLWSVLPLLAQRDPRLSGIASGMRARQAPPDPQTVWGLLLALGGLILVFWLIALMLDRLEQRGPRNSPWGLFYSLGKIHQLRWSELWLLWRLARRQHLTDPARIFLEPERLEAAQLTHWSATQQEQFQALRKRLFVGLPGFGGTTTAATPGEPARSTEVAIPMFPLPQAPALDLPPWNASSGDTPAPLP